MEYGLIGRTLTHSLSPVLHARFGGYCYECAELSPGELGPFLTARNFLGLNVTMPYKTACIPYLDGLSPEAEAAGAVNTIVNRGGSLWGDNTDFGGLAATADRMGISFAGKTVLIAGSGGTSRTALALARQRGAKQALRMSRSGAPDTVSYEAAYQDHADAEILINTTPAGMTPDLEGVAVDISRLPGLTAVIDAVYTPLITRLVQQARRRGIPAETGLYLLVTQAALSAERFTGKRICREQIDRVYGELRRARRNLVLIGMPGSGKTTVGRLLAARLGRPFFDTDGQLPGDPADILRTQGEPAFRELETAAVRALAEQTGAVIATGGGVVLREQNIELLSQNGILIFLDRPLERLSPDGAHPLTDSAEKLAAAAQARRPRYLAAAELRISAAGTAEQTADAILAGLEELP